MMYKRLLKISAESTKSFFLFGPRGTGKTSWVKQVFVNNVYLDLLDGGIFQRLQAHPERLSQFIPPDYTGWIILDEVQKLPALLNEVHRLIEQKHYRFILTGSSARSLRRRGVNLLAGRALYYAMHPLTAIELGKDFNLKRALRYGQLPAITSETDPKHYLESYVKAYVREEVMQEGLTRNLSAFSKFLEIASFSQGSLLNTSIIAREIGVDQKTISNYFDLLEDLLLANRLPVFTKRAKRKLVSHSKFYYFDVGIYHILRPMGPLDSIQESDGFAMESLVLQESKAINSYLRLGYEFYFWRTRHGTEVDFILYGEKGLIAIEVKSSSSFDKSDLRGLRSFAEDYPIAKLYLVYGGEHSEYVDNITIMPVIDFLKNLPEILK